MAEHEVAAPEARRQPERDLARSGPDAEREADAITAVHERAPGGLRRHAEVVHAGEQHLAGPASKRQLAARHGRVVDAIEQAQERVSLRRRRTRHQRRDDLVEANATLRAQGERATEAVAVRPAADTAFGVERECQLGPRLRAQRGAVG